MSRKRARKRRSAPPRQPAAAALAPTKAHARRALLERKARQPWSVAAPTDDWTAWLDQQDHPFGPALAAVIPAPKERVGLVTPDTAGIAAVSSLAQGAHEHFFVRQQEEFERLRALLASLNPIPVVVGSMFFLRFSPWGRYYEPSSLPNDLDYELITGLIAAQVSPDVRDVSANDLKDVLALAREVRYLAHATAMAVAWSEDSESPDSEAKRRSIGRFLMLRGDAYAPHGRWFAERLVREFSGDASAYGRVLLDAFRAADALAERWMSEWTVVFGAIWGAAVESSGETPPSTAEASGKFMEAFATAIIELLPRLIAVSRDQFAAFISPEDDAAVRADAVLSALALRPGGWAEPFTGPLSEPPLRSKPMLVLPSSSQSDASRSATEQVVLVHLNGLAGDAATTVDFALSSARVGWPRVRARVVDQCAAEQISTLLPGCTTYLSVFSAPPGADDRFELDALVAYDDVCFLFEGKAAPLKTPSRRGDVARLRAQLVDIVGNGWSQLKRDDQFVHRSSTSPLPLFDERGAVMGELAAGQVRETYLVLPTFDGLDSFATHLSDLVEWGVLPAMATPWIVSVTDLRIVCEALRDPAELVAYADHRSRWAGVETVFFPDEIEMLASFLEGTDLWQPVSELRAAEGEAGFVMVGGGQSRFDDWYAFLLGEGPKARQPRRKTTKPVRRFVDHLSASQPPRWLAASAAVLTTPMSYAWAYDQASYQLAKRARSERWFLTGDRNVSFLVAANGVPWAEVIRSGRIENQVEADTLVWFIRGGKQGRTELEWACVGRGVTSEMPPVTGT